MSALATQPQERFGFLSLDVRVDPSASLHQRAQDAFVMLDAALTAFESMNEPASRTDAGDDFAAWWPALYTLRLAHMLAGALAEALPAER